MIRQTVILGGASGTIFEPLALVLLVVGACLLLLLPRRYALVALLAPALFIPVSQHLVIQGLDLTAFRIFVAVGLMRWLASGDRKALEWSHPLDRAVVYYSIAKVVTFTLLWMSVPALVNRLGYFFDDVGGYLLFRHLIRDRRDAESALKVLAVVCVIFGGFMLHEYLTGHNAMAFLGSGDTPALRLGKVRAQGSFAHAVLAGTFGATLFPIFCGYLLKPAQWSRAFAGLAAAAACVMVLASTSSGPALTLGAGFAGLLAWPVRNYTRWIKWSVVLGLVGLHLVMNDPVWSLLFRVRGIGGGSGYHRYQLIDQSVNHFGEWWLLGTKDNGSWGLDMWDLANHYIASGITGGLISLILFLVILHRTYVALSGLRARAVAAGDRATEWRAWALTNAVLAHSVAYFGISYFDQNRIHWLCFLSIVVAVSREQEIVRPPLAAIPPPQPRLRVPIRQPAIQVRRSAS